MVRLRVKEVAEQQGITDATKLSRATGVAYETAYRLWHGDVGDERRSVGIVTLHRIAKALGVTASDLYEEEGRTRLLARCEPHTSSRAEDAAYRIVGALRSSLAHSA